MENPHQSVCYDYVDDRIFGGEDQRFWSHTTTHTTLSKSFDTKLAPSADNQNCSRWMCRLVSTTSQRRKLRVRGSYLAPSSDQTVESGVDVVSFRNYKYILIHWVRRFDSQNLSLKLGFWIHAFAGIDAFWGPERMDSEKNHPWEF